MSLAKHYVTLAKHSHRRAMHYKRGGSMFAWFTHSVQRDFFLDKARGK